MAGIRPKDLGTKCPAELKNAHWQKAKGKVGKLIKTGLSAELKKFDALLKKVDMSVLDPASSPSNTMQELAKKIVVSKREIASKIGPLQKQLFVVRDKAVEAEIKLKSTSMGSNAADASLAIGSAAEFYAAICKSLDLKGAIDAAKVDIDKKNALAAVHLNGLILKFLTGAKIFLTAPTETSWRKNITQQGRKVSNSLAQLQYYRAKFWAKFAKFKDFDAKALKISKDPNFAEKSAYIVARAVEQVKLIADFKA